MSRPTVSNLDSLTPSSSYLLTSSRVFLADRGSLARAYIHICNGKVAAIYEEGEEIPSNIPVMDVSPSLIMPGIVDTHVHCNEPGRTDWEGLATATKAAAAGGVTTIVDMPLNSIPPTTTVEGIQAKCEAAKGKCMVDVGFWGGIIPDNRSSLIPLANAGALGFKCFLIESGVDEFPAVSPQQLKDAMITVHQDAPHLPILIHAEQCSHPHGVHEDECQKDADQTLYSTYLASRPTSLEETAIQTAIDLSAETGAKTHIVHLSAATALPMVKKAIENNPVFSVETCPHYLTLDAESIPMSATHYKCAPPIREKGNQIQLWNALREGIISMIVSDHSPCNPALKLNQFDKSWGGISSLQLALPLIFSELRNQMGDKYDLTTILKQIVQWMCVAPAKFANIHHRKGGIRVGYDADFAIWNEEETITITPSLIQFKHKVTPYMNRVLNGRVVYTIVRGQVVYAADQSDWKAPIGQQVFAAQHPLAWSDNHSFGEGEKMPLTGATDSPSVPAAQVVPA